MGIRNSTHDKGGPAFPTPEFYDEQLVGGYEGMTLRDYFAAKAMAAMTANATDYDLIARWAYCQADAMLKAREGK
jgi:Leu/Phe-tRNA-protein transferase